MEVPSMTCTLPDDLVDQLCPMPEAPPGCIGLDAALGRRLATAKARLDRMEREVVSRDLSALAMARVEFALAARALADDLIARGLHTSGESD
ncbi:hypothetical protein CR158_07895 [Halomonas heilongjiangensis]|uniref:Uncharacterized protein n=2 Tax=Halomonas heilongjiangensis TaxID=1387883 RepID=A0A2N7TVG5_9GAMM|nr:hypothetical protein C1H66_00535 [Halomonas heilongjiangensis]PXX91421.1 hypothetical protein CR158_07895 [Halomonas heilongjiangensis]